MMMFKDSVLFQVEVKNTFIHISETASTAPGSPTSPVSPNSPSLTRSASDDSLTRSRRLGIFPNENEISGLSTAALSQQEDMQDQRSLTDSIEPVDGCKIVQINVAGDNFRGDSTTDYSEENYEENYEYDYNNKKAPRGPNGRRSRVRPGKRRRERVKDIIQRSRDGDTDSLQLLETLYNRPQGTRTQIYVHSLMHGPETAWEQTPMYIPYRCQTAPGSGAVALGRSDCVDRASGFQ
eukprot:TRINITY_DN112941_c0_g1_i1.p1 TRINITY_DN112941_c0_g1~~TRINITY_DN112941_c0_g1_i1.p1  ORF type:complete len:237 (+),score=43.35 TRINITY_DN112941_c0_g1_i1:145-855(+)